MIIRGSASYASMVMVKRLDGTAITSGTVTVYITKDNGTQGTLGTATHEGNGEWSIALSGTDTTCDYLSLTWTHTDAAPQFWAAFPWDSSRTGTLSANVVQISGDSGAADNLEAACDGTGYNVGNGSIVAASVTGAVGSVTGNVGGNVSGSVGSVTGAVGSIGTGGIASTSFATGAITATAIAADAIGASELATDAVTEIVAGVWNAARATYASAGTFGQGVASVQGNVTGSVASVTGAVGSVTGNVGGNVSGSVGSVTGAVGSVTGNVGGNVTGSVGSIATGGITSGSFAADSITAAALATDAVSEIQTGLSTLDAAGIRNAVGLATNDLDAQLAAIDTVVDSILVDTGTDGVKLDLTQTGLSPRNVSAVGDSSLTVGDALVCAIVAAAGQETISSTTYTVKTPSTATTVRVFTLDSATTPTSRT